jgi:glycosyltransferase involved in cell wall biosynthesis
MNNVFYIETGPILHEKYFSGIPNVTLHIIEELDKLNLNLHFFHGNSLLSPDVVREVVKLRDSQPFRTAESKGELIIGHLTDLELDAGNSVGIYTNSRHGNPKYFSFECQIVYDLTPLITPAYHHPDTVEFYKSVYEIDYKIADMLFCISKATKTDLLTYLPYTENDSVEYSLLAGEVIPGNIADTYLMDVDHLEVEPYVLVMGTVEPRKNLSLIFEMFNKYPSVLTDNKWVFCGRDGWMMGFDDLKEVVDDDKKELMADVIRLNYVTELQKICLLRKAKLLVFPSLYEGFGLPVLEALQEGCPVVASASSSIPEAGGKVTEYFDPTDVDSLFEAYSIINKKSVNKDFRNKCVEHSYNYSWASFAKDLLNAIERRLV